MKKRHTKKREITREEILARKCGDCRLCCKVCSVDERGTLDGGEPYEFHKRAGKWCEHAGNGGCAVHDDPTMPKSCGIFLCAWRQGFGDEDDRPDKAKVVVTGEDHPKFGFGMVFYEAWPGSIEQNKRAQRLLTEALRIKAVNVVVLVPSNTSPRKLWIRETQSVEMAVPASEQFDQESLTVDTDGERFRSEQADYERVMSGDDPDAHYGVPNENQEGD